MSEEKKLESVNTGSSGDVDPKAANLGNLGESTETKDNAAKTEAGKTTEATVSESQYKELEIKLGSQGKELGDLRTFYDEISPLMEKLQANPELVDAILKDKISPELIKPVAEGKVSTEDAKEVTKAHEEVKKDLGKEGYQKTSSDDIKKLIEEKVNEAKDEFQKTFQRKIHKKILYTRNQKK